MLHGVRIARRADRFPAPAAFSCGEPPSRRYLPEENMRPAFAIALLLAATCVRAADTASTVASELDVLKMEEGVWDAAIEFPPAAPGQAPTHATGVQTNTFVTGKRWIATTSRSTRNTEATAPGATTRRSSATSAFGSTATRTTSASTKVRGTRRRRR
jgi:hypothetical protein